MPTVGVVPAVFYFGNLFYPTSRSPPGCPVSSRMSRHAVSCEHFAIYGLIGCSERPFDAIQQFIEERDLAFVQRLYGEAFPEASLQKI